MLTHTHYVVRSQVMLCSDSWSKPAAFYRVAKPVDSHWTPAVQLEALQHIVQMLTAGSDAKAPVDDALSLCSVSHQPFLHGEYLTVIYDFQNEYKHHVVYWRADCNQWVHHTKQPAEETEVTALAFRVNLTTFMSPIYGGFPFTGIPTWDEQLTSCLLQFDQLSSLNMEIWQGTLPAQLGSLKQLKYIDISHHCMQGELPANYFLDQPDLSVFKVYRLPPNSDRLNPDWLPLPLCGLTGGVPAISFGKPRTLIDLHNNQLSGQLPILQLYMMTSVELLDLSNNLLTGPIPWQWWSRYGSMLNPHALNISLANNQLSGEFPVNGMIWVMLCVEDFVLGGPTYMSYFALDVSNNNQLQGCFPKCCDHPVAMINFDSTKMTGPCSSNVTTACS